MELASPIDEAIWEYSAWLWAVYNAPPYVGSFENKPPGIFLLYRFCFDGFGLNLWPVRLLGVAAIVGTLFLVYTLARRYKGRIAGGMAALIFGLSMGHHATDGYMLAVTETFMIFFTALAFYLLSSIYWRRPAQSHWCFMLGIGAAFGAALCFKQIALADMVGLIPMYWVATWQNASPRRILLDALLMLVAGSAVTVFSLLPLIADGVTLRDYWYGTWQILFYQSSAISAAERLKLIASTWTNPALVAYYPFVILYVFQKKRLQRAGIPFWSLLFWLSLAFTGANASNVYRHQIKQVMLPLSLVAGIGIGGFVESMSGFTSRWVLCLYLAVVAALAPFNSALIGIAKQALPNVMPCPGAEEEQTNRCLADYIRLNTYPSDYVYIWSINSHSIHLYSERRSPCRYSNAIFQCAPDFEATTAAELAACPPKLILINDRGDKVRPVPACVSRLLARDYAPIRRIDGFQVFKRLGSESLAFEQRHGALDGVGDNDKNPRPELPSVHVPNGSLPHLR